MNRQAKSDMMPIQPYIVIHSENYERIVVNDMGISHFYEFTMKKEKLQQLKAVPDGSIDLLFSIGGQKVVTYISGTVLGAKKWLVGEGGRCFGVRFQPGRCILPDEISIEAIINEDVELEHNSFGANLAEQIAQGKNIQERAGLFLEAYIKLLYHQEVNAKAGRLEPYICQRIFESRGNVAIQQLSEETGYSPCYIRRIFKKVHGISPKVFEEFVRFQNVLHTMNRSVIQQKQNISEGSFSIPWRLKEIAVGCGYYDQSHMMKKFKCFTGVTPEIYFTLISGKENLI